MISDQNAITGISAAFCLGGPVPFRGAMLRDGTNRGVCWHESGGGHGINCLCATDFCNLPRDLSQVNNPGR